MGCQCICNSSVRVCVCGVCVVCVCGVCVVCMCGVCVVCGVCMCGVCVVCMCGVCVCVLCVCVYVQVNFYYRLLWTVTARLH